MEPGQYQNSEIRKPLFVMQAEIAALQVAIPIARAVRGTADYLQVAGQRVSMWCRENEPAIRRLQDVCRKLNALH